MKLQFLPEKNGYSLGEGDFRSDMGQTNAPSPTVGKAIPRTFFNVNCRFVLTADEFPQFMMFYQAHEWGAVFQADLILEAGELEECQCKFVQETLVVSNKGLTYYVDIQMFAARM